MYPHSHGIVGAPSYINSGDVGYVRASILSEARKTRGRVIDESALLNLDWRQLNILEAASRKWRFWGLS